MRICGCRFENNVSTIQGGALFTCFYSGTSSQSIISNTTFLNNKTYPGDVSSANPDGLGGAIHHEYGILSLTDSTLSGNATTLLGGGIYLYTDEDASFINDTFVGNAATLDTGGSYVGGGGAIWIVNGRVDFINCTIANNTALDNVGGIVAADYSTCQVTIKNTLLSGNLGLWAILFNAACNRVLIDGGGNIQYPQNRPDGSADVKCTDAITITDPLWVPGG